MPRVARPTPFLLFHLLHANGFSFTSMPVTVCRRSNPSNPSVIQVRTNYETDPGIREAGILHRLQNSMFSKAYVKNTELANDFVLPRLIKMFSRNDGYFAGAPRH
jgi:hypothetical protein